MAEQKKTGGGLKLADQATLSLLVALEEKEQISQRSLAVRLGVALGLTNSLLKRAVRKGFLKVSEAPAKRYAYYVTPKGFREKGSLVAEYLTSSLSFFRLARGQYVDIYQKIIACGHERVVLYGNDELGEIAYLSAQEVGLELCGIIHPGSNQSTLSGLSVYSSTERALADNIDAVVIASSDNPQAAYDHLCEHISAEKVFSAPFLHISRTANRKAT